MSKDNVTEVSFQPDGAAFPDADVTLRTNGMQGGDAGHGGFVEVTIRNPHSTIALDVSVDGRLVQGVENFVLRFRGDWEYRAAHNMFEILAEALKAVLIERPDEVWQWQERTKVVSKILKPKDPEPLDNMSELEKQMYRER